MVLCSSREIVSLKILKTCRASSILQRIEWSTLQYRVRRSHSLKAKLSKNEVIFFLTLKRKKVFFSLCSHANETLQKAKTMEAKRKELSEKLQFL
jgi:hypothetical protein